MSRDKMRRMLARDRRGSAIHEAGHYVMARHVGVRSGAAWIYASNPADPLQNKTTLGHFTAPHEELRRLSYRRLIMVSFAGAIAGHAWSVRSDTREGADGTWFDWMCIEEEVSPADWDLAGLAPEYMPRAADTAIEKAWDLLRPDDGQLWRPLCETARAMMQHGFVEMKPGVLAAAREARAQLERLIAERRERAMLDGVLPRQ